MRWEVNFTKDQIKEMAIYTIELTIQGIVWKSVNAGDNGWVIILTGGF